MFGSAPPGGLIQEIDDAHRQEGQLMARKPAAVAALLWHREEEFDAAPDPDHATVSGFQRTTAEIAAAMNLSPRRQLPGRGCRDGEVPAAQDRGLAV